MGSSCLTDYIECPQCGRPARLDVESNFCHDWNTVDCSFCGYTEETDFDDPDNPTTITKAGVGVLARSNNDFVTCHGIRTEKEFADILCVLESENNELKDFRWIRLTRWNRQTKAVDVVYERSEAGHEVCSTLRLDYYLPPDHVVWWEKEFVPA